MAWGVIMSQMDMLETGFWTYLSHFCSQVFQNHILIEATRYTPLFGTAVCTSGSDFLKKMAYNTFFVVSVRLAILGLYACFRVVAVMVPKHNPNS